MSKRCYFPMGGIHKGEGLDPGAEPPLVKLVE